MLRIMNRAVARSGMMFAAVPPSRTIPWTRACCGSCWRQSPIPWKRRTTASSAFLPSQGSPAAWAALPVNVTSTSSLARSMQPTMSRSPGWKRSAASRPSMSPSSSMNCLPLPRSSAGVPRKTISPANASRSAARAIAAPTPGRRHRVVAAAVAQPRQRVVLGQDADPRPVRAPAARQPAPDGGREAPRGVLHRVARRARSPRRTRRPPGAPRRPAPGWRGSGRRARGSRAGRPRRRRRRGP